MHLQDIHRHADGESITIFQRIAKSDKTAAEKCLKKHGKLVWALAKQFTNSNEDAETAAQEIFLDLWKYAERFDSTDCKNLIL